MSEAEKVLSRRGSVLSPDDEVSSADCGILGGLASDMVLPRFGAREATGSPGSSGLRSTGADAMLSKS